jgi:hypothetical protein
MKLVAMLAASDVPDQTIGAICDIKVKLSMCLFKHVP